MAVPMTLRWIVTGQQRPSIKQALWVGDHVKQAVQDHILAGRPTGILPEELRDHTEDGGQPRDDPHPFYLPEDADDDGFIDHVVLHAPHGLHADWCGELESLQLAAGPAGCPPPFGLRADWFGRLDRDTPPGRLFGPSRVWCSMTPYVSNVHRLAPIAALRRDLGCRKFPEPTEIEELPVSNSHGYKIVRHESDESKVLVSKSKQRGAFFRLVFPTPTLPSPVAFGFACHIGLGLFHREHTILSGVHPDS